MPERDDPRWPGAGPEPAGPPAHHDSPSPAREPSAFDGLDIDAILTERAPAGTDQVTAIRDAARDTMSHQASPTADGQLPAPGERGSSDVDGPSALEAAIADYGPVAKPVNWIDLPAWLAEQEWLGLNNWVHWLRTDFGLPAAVIPPCWHLHPELVWELSALRSAWLHAYDPQQNAAGPIAWLAQFTAARDRLRAWVQTAGCKIDRHRTTRTATWPGEHDHNDPTEYRIASREDEFIDFILYDVQQREQAEADRRNKGRDGENGEAQTSISDQSHR